MAVPRSSPYYYGGGGRAPARPAVKTPAKPAKSPYPKFVPPPRQPAAAPDYTQQATSDIAPLYAGLVSQLNAQRDIGEQGIAGYTKSFANMLGGYNPQAAYGKAAEAQAALDAALQQSLTGTGQNLSQGLAGQLAQINAPGETTSRVIGGLNAATTGAANAGLAKGSATLSALLAQGAAAGSYASQLPGYAAGLGLQQTRLLEGQTAQQVGQTLANEPKDVLSRADALQSAAASASDRAATSAYRKQTAADTAAYRKAELGKTKVFGSAASGYYRLDKNGRAVQVTQPGAKPAKVFGSGSTGYFTIDENGNTVRLTKPGPKSAKPPKIFGSASGGYYQYNLDGSVTKIVPGTGSKGAKGGATKYQSVTVNGHTVTFDPKTGTYYTPGTTTPVDPNTLTKPPKPVPVKALASARNYLFGQSHGYFATQDDPDTPLTPSQVTAAQNAGQTVGRVTVGQHQDDEIQKTYLTLIQKYGVPARQAFQMVAGQFKQWGQTHQKAYFPNPGKAAAVAEPTAYTGRQQLGKNELASLWVQAGGDPRAANTAAAVALAESSGRVDALNDNPATGDYSVSPWQINYFQGLRGPRTRQFGSPEQLRRDPLAAARAAVAISKNGRDFSPWTTYTSGKYRAYA